VQRQKLGAIEMNVMNQIANKKDEQIMTSIIKGSFVMLEDVLVTIDRLYGGYNDKIKELYRKNDEVMYQLREISKHVDFKIV